MRAKMKYICKKFINHQIKKCFLFRCRKENPISMTNEYTYLSLKLTPNTKFDIASQQLSEKR